MKNKLRDTDKEFSIIIIRNSIKIKILYRNKAKVLHNPTVA